MQQIQMELTLDRKITTKANKKSIFSADKIPSSIQDLPTRRLRRRPIRSGQSRPSQDQEPFPRHQRPRWLRFQSPGFPVVVVRLPRRQQRPRENGFRVPVAVLGLQSLEGTRIKPELPAKADDVQPQAHRSLGRRCDRDWRSGKSSQSAWDFERAKIEVSRPRRCYGCGWKNDERRRRFRWNEVGFVVAVFDFRESAHFTITKGG